MTAAALLAEAVAAGLSLRVVADRVLVRPISQAPPDLLQRLRERKAELLLLLRERPDRLSVAAPDRTLTDVPGLTRIVDEARLMIRYLREYVLPRPALPAVRERLEAAQQLPDPAAILDLIVEVEREVIAAGGELPARFALLKANLIHLVEAVARTTVELGPLNPTLIKVQPASWPAPCSACNNSFWLVGPGGRLCLSCNPHLLDALNEARGEAAHG